MTTVDFGCAFAGDFLECPIGAEFVFNETRSKLQATLKCPVDSVNQGQIVEASQNGLCQCEASLFPDIGSTDIDETTAIPLDCDCFACSPETSAVGWAFSCSEPVLGDCTQLDCFGQCVEDSNTDVCFSKEIELDCVEASCHWCMVEGYCKPDAAACSPGSIDGCTNTTKKEDCTAAGPCGWCEEEGVCQLKDATCEAASSGGSGGCARIANETTCGDDTDCFWCSDKEVCRSSESQCPGSGGASNVCAAVNNQTICMGKDDCFWCEEQSTCRNSEQECPGQGRGNPCMGLNGTKCELAGCLWCEEAELCVASRSNRGCPSGNFTGNATSPGMGGSNACPLLENEGNCTSNLACRWCGDDSMCTSAQSSCSDGSIGTRGNPCEEADSQETCLNGCLWCAHKSECQKPADGACFDFDGNATSPGNACPPLNAFPECNAAAECQWCDAQSRCKLAQASCGDPIGEAGVELGGIGAILEILDEGLGLADEDAVELSLQYLFEVTEDGSTIVPSLIDFVVEEFEVRQEIGQFFASNITARRISFEATIEGAGTIELDAYVFLQNGTIATEAGEVFPVVRGDLKFNLVLRNWSFCDATNPCGGSDMTSEFVDVAVKIRGKNMTPKPSNSSSLIFNLGGDVPLTLSNQVEVDDFIQGMPLGFPRAESSLDQGTVFVFRFPRFIDSVIYDPVIGFHQALIEPPQATDPPVTAPTAAPPTILVRETDAPSTTQSAETDVPTATPDSGKTPETKGGDDDGLSVGAIVGIAVAGFFGLCCCCAVVGLLVKKQKEGQTDKDVPNATTFQDSFDDEGLLKDEENGNIDDDDDDDDEEDESDEDEEDESDEDEEDDDDDDDDDEESEEDDDDEEDEESDEEDSEEEDSEEEDSDDDGVV